MLPPPTKLVTPGVLRTTYHESGSENHLDQHVAGYFLLHRVALPWRISISSSIGTRTWKSCHPCHRLDAVLEIGLDLVL